jgi:hypothetical protein
MPYLDAYKLFVSDNGSFLPIQTEVPFYSEKYGFCGRVDLRAHCGGYVSVVDLKSGQPHDGDRYQTAAYLFGLKDAGFPCWKAFDLYLTKRGKYKLIEQKNPTNLFLQFMGGVRKWREENNGNNRS